MHGWDSGQRFRPGSGRWANPGGKNKEKYRLWHKEGNRSFFHPKNENGYWSFRDSGFTDAEARAEEQWSKKKKKKKKSQGHESDLST